MSPLIKPISHKKAIKEQAQGPGCSKLGEHNPGLVRNWNSDMKAYSKEPKRMTSFNQLTFFHAEINQSEVEDSFQLASDWIKSAQKNVNKSKRSHFWALCCKK